jgi:hypothetical protein
MTDFKKIIVWIGDVVGSAETTHQISQMMKIENQFSDVLQGQLSKHFSTIFSHISVSAPTGKRTLAWSVNIFSCFILT